MYAALCQVFGLFYARNLQHRTTALTNSSNMLLFAVIELFL